MNRFINKYGVYVCVYVCAHMCEDQLKNSLADQGTLIECDQMRFIFQHIPPIYGPHTSSNITVLGSH